MLTASGEDGDIRTAFAARANGYLHKPGHSDDLLALMRDTLAFWLAHNLAPSRSDG